MIKVAEGRASRRRISREQKKGKEKEVCWRRGDREEGGEK